MNNNEHKTPEPKTTAQNAQKDVSPPPGYGLSTALRHIDELRNNTAALENELKWISKHRPLAANTEDALAANEYDALLVSSHCAWIALNALKVGSDVFEHVHNPKEPILAEAKRAFTLGMPLVRLLNNMGDLPDAKQEELSERKAGWPLPEGLVARCVSQYLSPLMLLISSYSYLYGEHEDMSFVPTPRRTLHKRGSIPPRSSVPPDSPAAYNNNAASTSNTAFTSAATDILAAAQIRERIVPGTHNTSKRGPPAYTQIKDEDSDDGRDLYEARRKMKASNDVQMRG